MVILVPTPHHGLTPPPKQFFNVDHVQAQNVTMCGCRTARTAKNPKTVITRSPTALLPNLLLIAYSSFVFLFFWATSIFEQYACFQMKFCSLLHVCWWIPELVSNHLVELHVKNSNPEVSESCAGIKKMSAQCSLLSLKAGTRPSLVSRLPNILHETNLRLLSGQMLETWHAKNPITKCFSIGNIFILSLAKLSLSLSAS